MYVGVEQMEVGTMTRKAKVNKDLTPRMREVLASDAPVTWGKNGLDTKREPFSAEERQLAGKIGTPEQGEVPPRKI